MKTRIAATLLGLSLYANAAQLRTMVFLQDAEQLRAIGVPTTPADSYPIALDVWIGTDREDADSFFVTAEYTLNGKPQTQRILVRASKSADQLTPTLISFRIGSTRPTITRIVIEPAAAGEVLATYEFSGQQITAARGLLTVE